MTVFRDFSKKQNFWDGFRSMELALERYGLRLKKSVMDKMMKLIKVRRVTSLPKESTKG